MQISDKARKVLNLSTKIFTWLLIVFTVFIMVFTVVSVTMFDKSDRDIFGYKFYIVQTESMNNEDNEIYFDAGDIIISKNVNYKDLRAGDVITFISTSPESHSQIVTHMIRTVNDPDGNISFTTFGTATGTNDSEPVYPEFILGKYSAKLPGVGHFFAFIKTTPGYVLCILVPFLLLILYNGANVIRLYRRYKGEQNAIIEAERAEIAAERKQTEEMLKELQALKAQLSAQSSDEKPKESVTAEENKADEKSAAED